MPSLSPFGNELATTPRTCAPTTLLALAFLLAAFGAGCTHHTVHAAVPRPVPPKPVQRAAPLPPDIHGESATDTTLVLVTLPVPPPPPERPRNTHKPASESSGDPEAAARPAAPQISPQISPADQAAYERRTNDSIGVAEKNLELARGHQLTSSQQDLVEKIRSFILESRDALQSSDWARAQNLAQKAQVLSVELVSTF